MKPLTYTAMIERSQIFRDQAPKRTPAVLNELGLGSLEECLFYPAAFNIVAIPASRPDTILKIGDREKGPEMQSHEAARLRQIAESDIRHMRVPEVLAYGKDYMWTTRLGMDLKEVYGRKTTMPEKEGIAVSVQLMRMQAMLWKTFGYYHEDATRENITQEANGEFGLIDFQSVMRTQPTAMSMLGRVAGLHPKGIIPAAEAYREIVGHRLRVKPLLLSLIKDNRPDNALLLEVLNEWEGMQRPHRPGHKRAAKPAPKRDF